MANMFQRLSVWSSAKFLESLRRCSSVQQKVSFRSHFPDVIKDVRSNLSVTHPEIPPATIDRIISVLEYNVPHGKLIRGKTVGVAYNHFTPEALQSQAHVRVSHRLGWCLEMTLSSMVIVDDIIDNSPFRRFRPSWHTLPDTGNNALTDSYFLNKLVFDLLKRQLDKPAYRYCYREILDIFLTYQLKTLLGNLQEYVTQNKSCELYTLDESKTIAIYKTAYITYVMPVFIGMHLSGVINSDLYKEMEKVLLLMGYFFQIKDDFIDCFGETQVIGKSGTDIVEGKCSWPFVTALENSDKCQKEILLENYGKPDSVCVERVKEVYRKVDVPKFFAEKQKSSRAEICERIEGICDSKARALLLELVGDLFKG